jgi:aldose sugar dehydrogenase
MTSRWLWSNLACLLGVVVLAAACAQQPALSKNDQPAAVADDDDDLGDPSGAKPGSGPTPTARPLPTTAVSGLRTELVAEGLVLPQSLVWTPDGRLFFVEVKKGDVRVLNGRTIQPSAVLNVAVSRGTEHGLISVVPDPAFVQNHFLYTYYSRPKKGSVADEPLKNRLTRWVEKDGTAGGELPILDEIPIGKGNHTGGKAAFADDGTLYLTIGDQGDASRRMAQEQNKLNGKLVRFESGIVSSMSKDSPDLKPTTAAGSATIWASGLRNPYGIDVHPVSGLPIVTDNGPDMCDEINLGRQGANFGNPTVECSPHEAGYDDPIWDSGPDRLGVTGLRIYRGNMFPEYVNQLLFCSVNTGNLMLATLDAPSYASISKVEQVVSGSDGEGCRLDVGVAPDGSIYYASMSRIFRLFRP